MKSSAIRAKNGHGRLGSDFGRTYTAVALKPPVGERAVPPTPPVRLVFFVAPRPPKLENEIGVRFTVVFSICALAEEARPEQQITWGRSLGATEKTSSGVASGRQLETFLEGGENEVQANRAPKVKKPKKHQKCAAKRK